MMYMRVMLCSLELLQQYFSVNEQCFTLTTNQHRPNFNKTNRAILTANGYYSNLMREGTNLLESLHMWLQ